jgi:putative endonuclease
MAVNRAMALGAAGEELAAQDLERRGYTILDRNWRGQGGEIDIVALAPGGVLAVVEVKTRGGTGFGAPAGAVTAAKYARLRRLAAAWLEAHEVRAAEVRIDVVAIILAPGAEPAIDHLPGAYR